MISIGLPNEIRQYRLYVQAVCLHEVKRLLEGQGLFPCYVFDDDNEVHTLIFTKRAPALEALSRLQEAGISAFYNSVKWVI